MDILVCVSKTPETTAKISFTDDNAEFNAEGVNHIMNPYDEWYALVRAVELVDQFGGEVTLLNVGPAANDSIIRKGLAIGADKAVRINAEPSSAFETANHIANFAKEHTFDGIFFGKETIDYNGSEVGSMVSELVDLPYVSFASKLEMEEEGKAIITRDIEGGVEVVEVPSPFCLSAAKGLAEQKIPNMRGIMMAKRKPLDVVEAETAESPVEVVEFRLPEEKGEVTLVDEENMDELIRLLHEEAKVI
ncbi:MAG: electron transfer flavoprotein beta subunit/FixA family protein [Bacteroidetes bacterium]|jgi:electron transfer flavoprotein beta subunit|nr:electron transfer flavoprotein beta subunit/FixA family protein [Bacteroidota bacterium]